MADVTASRVGPGAVLVAAYALFVVAAGARSIVQLTTDAGRPPLAYALSAAAALVYLANLLLLRRIDRGGAVGATVCVGLELAGVLVVGTLTVLRPSLFADATVWSQYGRGYGFVPLLLPLLALCWLRRRPT